MSSVLSIDDVVEQKHGVVCICRLSIIPVSNRKSPVRRPFRGEVGADKETKNVCWLDVTGLCIVQLKHRLCRCTLTISFMLERSSAEPHPPPPPPLIPHLPPTIIYNVRFFVRRSCSKFASRAHRREHTMASPSYIVIRAKTPSQYSGIQCPACAQWAAAQPRQVEATLALDGLATACLLCGFLDFC